MSLPPEITTPISDFFSKNAFIIIIAISCVIVGYVSVIFMVGKSPIKVEIEKVIEAETGSKLDRMPEVKKQVAREDGAWGPTTTPEGPKGANGPAEPKYC